MLEIVVGCITLSKLRENLDDVKVTLEAFFD